MENIHTVDNKIKVEDYIHKMDILETLEIEFSATPTFFDMHPRRNILCNLHHLFSCKSLVYKYTISNTDLNLVVWCLNTYMLQEAMIRIRQIQLPLCKTRRFQSYIIRV